ncbi:hypothetical protein LINGRAHAP2_LOCUS5927 [Linum grandiflorum]
MEDPRTTPTRFHLRPGLREPDRHPPCRHHRRRRNSLPRRPLLLRHRLPNQLSTIPSESNLPVIRVADQPEPIPQRAGLLKPDQYLERERGRELEP